MQDSNSGGKYMALALRNLAGPSIRVLKGRISGEVILPGEEAYDTARRVWNGMIDRSSMKEVHVDPVARVVHAQAGVQWGELDRATQEYGLATPGGEVSDTGIAGLTLGGGMGYLRCKYGL